MVQRLALVALLAALMTPALKAEEDAEVKALATIKKLGGKVTRDETAPGKPVVQVVLSASKATDADLAQLKIFKQLKSLYFFISPERK
jgi:internalin A